MEALCGSEIDLWRQKEERQHGQMGFIVVALSGFFRTVWLLQEISNEEGRGFWSDNLSDSVKQSVIAPRTICLMVLFVSQCNAMASQISHLLRTQMIAESLRKWKEKSVSLKKLFGSFDPREMAVQLVIVALLRTIGPIALFVPQCNTGALLIY